MAKKKGSPVVSTRIPKELLAMIDEIIARSSDTRRDGPWTRSSFFLAALEDKVKHLDRSSRRETRVNGEYERDLWTY